MPIKSYKGNRPELGKSVYIDEYATVIGQVTIGNDVSIWPMTVIRGDVFHITIGEGTNIQDACVLHGTHQGEYSPEGFPVTIGKGVTVGHRAVIHGCTIGNNCLIGIGAIVMDGVNIEDNVIVGAGSLVPPGKTLKAGNLYVGAPIRKVRQLTPKELEMLEYSGQHYVQLKNQYLHEQSSN